MYSEPPSTRFYRSRAEGSLRAVAVEDLMLYGNIGVSVRCTFVKKLGLSVTYLERIYAGQQGVERDVIFNNSLPVLTSLTVEPGFVGHFLS